jgi:hypothetical protein
MSALADAPPFPFLRCERCREHLDEGDLFCPNCGHEAPPSEKNREHVPAGRIQVHRFECGGCGATLTWELEAQGLHCAFCGQAALQEREDVRIPAPRLVLPFRIDQAQAGALFRDWLGRGIFRPSDLTSASKVTELRGVYVPFWSFSVECHIYWTADSNATPPGAKAEWAPYFGEHSTCYEHLLVPASGALGAYRLGRIGGWDLAQAVPYAPELVRDVPAEAFSVTRKKARAQVFAELETKVRTDCTPQVPGSRKRNLKVNPLYAGAEASPLLAPVWIFAYEYRGRRYQFLINGQNGKADGRAPVSPWKILAAIALALLVLTLLEMLKGN